MPVRRLAALAVAAWGVALAVNRSLRRVEGPSMLPGLVHGDLLLTVPVRRAPRVGDVVVTDLPGVGPTVKRVVAGPRHDVILDEGHLLVDGAWHDEPWVTPTVDGTHRWPPGDGWVLLGDHRARSTDSRTVGRVPTAAITRRVIARTSIPTSSLRRSPVPRPGPRHRDSARLVVLAPDDRVLLFRILDGGDAGHVWMTPGGGRRPGESIEANARRELAEEVGQPADRLAPIDLGGSRRRVGRFAGSLIDHHEDWVAVRVASATVDDTGWTDVERAELLAQRWCTDQDLATFRESGVLVTEDLEDLVVRARSLLG